MFEPKARGTGTTINIVFRFRIWKWEFWIINS